MKEVDKGGFSMRADSRLAFELKLLGVLLREVFVYPTLYSDIRANGQTREIKVRRFDLTRISRD